MFTPRYVKHGRLLLRHAEKLVRYRRDVIDEGTLSRIKALIKELKKSLKARNELKAREESKELHDLYMANLPAPKELAWRENIEVILVAIVVAVGVRSFFLQPFK